MKERVAGRELDCEIAHRVMGWSVSSLYSTPDSKEHTIQGLRAPDGIGGVDLDPPNWKIKYSVNADLRGIPHYSTDIAATWHLVEKVAETISDFTLERAGAQWYAAFGGVSAKADTAPLAICLAALEAVL